jgi:hypothetical protein
LWGAAAAVVVQVERHSKEVKTLLPTYRFLFLFFFFFIRQKKKTGYNWPCLAKKTDYIAKKRRKKNQKPKVLTSTAF